MPAGIYLKRSMRTVDSHQDKVTIVVNVVISAKCRKLCAAWNIVRN